TSRTDSTHDRQALRGILVMDLYVTIDHLPQLSRPLERQSMLFDQDVGQSARLVTRPEAECRHQLIASDQSILQGQQSEQQIAINHGVGHGPALFCSEMP